MKNYREYIIPTSPRGYVVVLKTKSLINKGQNNIMTITFILGFIFVALNTTDVWMLKVFTQQLGEDKAMLLRGLGSIFLGLIFVLPFARVSTISGFIVLVAIAFYGVLCSHLSLMGISRCNIVISEMFIKASFVMNVAGDILFGYIGYSLHIVWGSILLFCSMAFMMDLKKQNINPRTLIYPILAFFAFGIQPYLVRYGYDARMFNTEAYVIVYLAILVAYFFVRTGKKNLKLEKVHIKYGLIQGLIFLVALMLNFFGYTICIPGVFRAISVLALGLIYIVGIVNKQEKFMWSKSTGVAFSIIGIVVLAFA